MVAACANSSYIIATTGPRCGLAAPSTAIAAGPGPKMMAMACAVVEQLKQRLQTVVENGDLAAATEAITQLESAELSKETLETTRVGRFVNDIRKLTAQQWPDFSKRCRALIKQWQKIAEYRPSSSCEGSSNGGTPQLVSPALRRGLTPRTTPGKYTPQQQQTQQRVTSTGLPAADARQITGQSSIENGIAASGSYAPLPKKVSPQMAAVVQQHTRLKQKSASVGAAIYLLEGGADMEEGTLNGGIADLLSDVATGALPVVPPTAEQSGAQPSLTIKLKRSASGVQRCFTANGISPPMQQSVHAARKNVQSTAELVAQLSEALPQHIGIDLGSTVKQGESSIQTSATPRVSPPLPIQTTAAATVDAKTTVKRRHIRKGGLPDVLEEPLEDEIPSVKQLKIGDEGIEEQKQMHEDMDVTAKKSETEVDDQKEKVKGKRGRKKKEVKERNTPNRFNWFDKYPLEAMPSMAEQPSTSSEQKSEEEESGPMAVNALARRCTSPTRSFLLPARERQLVLLPYVDIGQPGWLVHRFPQPERFIFPDPSEWTAASQGPPKQ